MGAVSVEETAAVGAQHLDGFLRGHRSLGDGLGLRGLFQRMGLRIAVQVLRNALPNQKQRIDQRGGQQHIK